MPQTVNFKRMKRILFIFSIILSTSFAAWAQDSNIPQLEKALLWEISGKELQEISYLYGTIHMIDANDFFITPEIEKALSATEKVTFEINMEEMNSLFAQMGLMMQAFMDNNTSLKDLLSEEDYKVVQVHFDKIGLPLFLFERIKPMFLSIIASTDMDPNALSSGKMVSYEMEFMKMAQDQEKTMGGLETAAYQMSMFDSIPYKVQADMLVESIKAGDSEEVDADAPNELDLMTKLYREQDIMAMQTMISAEDSDYADYEDLLLVNRNKNWIPVMEEMMNAQPTFFAVGAGHLAGEFGVINLLREAGYTLTPISFTVE